MKLIITVAILLTTFFTGEKWKLLIDESNKYTITYPASWKVEPQGDLGKMLTAPYTSKTDTFPEMVLILAVPNISLSDSLMFVNDSAMQANLAGRIQGYSFINSKYVYIKGKRILCTSFKANYFGGTHVITQYSYFRTPITLLIALDSNVPNNPIFIPIVEKMIGSLKFQD